MKVAILYREGSGCDYHRLLTPFSDFPKGVDLVFVKYGDTYSEEIFNVDVVVFNRTFGQGLEELLRLKEKYNFKIILDLDDYWVLPYSHYLYNMHKEFNHEEKALSFIKHSDYIWVTTELLRDKVKEITKNPVEIIPNSINFSIPQFNLPSPSIKDSVVFGYASSPSHKEDLGLIKNLFKRLGSDSTWKKSGEFILGGYENHVIFHDKIKMIKPAENVSVSPVLPLDSYMNLYKELNVAVAPLQTNSFNIFKSNLKFLEAGAAHLPFICSNTSPYKEHKVKGVFLCNTTQEWYQAFTYLLKNTNAIQELGEMNFEVIKTNFNMENTNQIRKQILEYVTRG
jgi:glycosyltransferase involved in cell wall biosynthesis